MSPKDSLRKQPTLVTASGRAPSCVWRPLPGSETGSSEWGSCAKSACFGALRLMAQVSTRRVSASPMRFSVS